MLYLFIDIIRVLITNIDIGGIAVPSEVAIVGLEIVSVMTRERILVFTLQPNDVLGVRLIRAVVSWARSRKVSLPDLHKLT